MKKKLLLAGATLLLAAAAVTGFSVYEQSNVSDLLNVNVEALARDESGDGSDYNCRCGLLWGDGCKTDNWGSHCAIDGTIWCSDFNSNCN